METLGVGTPKKRYKRAVLKSARRYAREGVKTTEKCVHIGNLLIFVRTVSIGGIPHRTDFP
jgi:hypothetical protein